MRGGKEGIGAGRRGRRADPPPRRPWDIDEFRTHVQGQHGERYAPER